MLVLDNPLANINEIVLYSVTIYMYMTTDMLRLFASLHVSLDININI